MFCPQGPPYSVDSSLSVYALIAVDSDRQIFTSAFRGVTLRLFIHTCPFVTTGVAASSQLNHLVSHVHWKKKKGAGELDQITK